MEETIAGTVFGNPLTSAACRRVLLAQTRLARQYPAVGGTALRPSEDPTPLPGLRRLAAGGAGSLDRPDALAVAALGGDPDSARNAYALASCALGLGFAPYWLELDGDQAGDAARLLAERRRFQPRQTLEQVFLDRAVSALLAPLFEGLPSALPLLAAHPWAAQAAVETGMEYVVNAVPGSLPLAGNLAEGSLHTVQTHAAYHGYRVLAGMDSGKPLNPMPQDSLACTGHYVPAALLDNLAEDCAARTDRKLRGLPLRLLLVPGGKNEAVIAELVRHLRPALQLGQARLAIDFGTDGAGWDTLCGAVRGLRGASLTHSGGFEDARTFRLSPEGAVNAFQAENALDAAAATVELVRWADVVITAPNALAFYPVPKLLLPAGTPAEAQNALHAAELGDSTPVCADAAFAIQRLGLFLHEDTSFMDMLENIVKNQINGIYDGALWAVRLLMGMRQEETK